jgi:2-isopropylmalate synthase
MSVHERHPYAGDLVFTAFSGSHQDAIKKGMDLRENEGNPNDSHWQVPYLSIDPRDLGRSYEAIIRINSQSGKGGVAYILSREFGLDLPKKMHIEIGEFVNTKADTESKELDAQDVFQIFQNEFLNRIEPLSLVSYSTSGNPQNDGSLIISSRIIYQGKEIDIKGSGNGPINAFVQALDQNGLKNFKLTDYRQHSIGEGSATRSATYIQLKNDSGLAKYGCGIDSSIEKSGILALVSAINRLF